MNHEVDDTKDAFDNPWTVLVIMVLIAGVLGGLGYLSHKSSVESDARYEAYKQEVESRPIKDLKNGFIQVNELNCRPALKGLTKRQMSELTGWDKWYAVNSTECGVVWPKIRIHKNRVQSYIPYFSILMWRDSKYDFDPGGPVHVKEVNIEDCKVAVGSSGDDVKWVVVQGQCKYMDLAL